MALDEIALVLENEDVYWNREWVPFAEGLTAVAAAVALGGRFLQRGLSQLEGGGRLPRVVNS